MAVPINHIAYLTFTEFLNTGLYSRQNLLKRIHDGKYSTIKDPSDKRKVLIEYSSLQPDEKAAVITANGDPLEQIKEDLRKKADSKKIDLETLWELDQNDKILITNTDLFTEEEGHLVNDLILAAAICRWYNGIKPSQCKEIGYKSKSELFEALHQHPRVKSLDGFYTDNKRVFQRRFTDFKKKDVTALINKNRKNQNALKIRTQDQKDVLIRLSASHKNRDMVWIVEDYNRVAKMNEWPEITETTASEFLNDEANLENILFRNGKGKFKSDVLPTIHRDRPSAPGLLWEGDGTPWELYYQYERDGKQYYWGRKVVYLVSDAFNDLPVGWAIGDSENTELITAAWKNAIENTGIMPFQIRVDNFARKALQPVYDQICKYFIPTAVGNARAKLIEQMFGRFSATRILKEYPNWSGCNITNRRDSNQPNRDFLNEEKKNFPDEVGVIAQINESINKFRNALIKKDNLIRFEAWVEGLRNAKHITLAGKPELIKIFGQWRHKIKSTYTYEFTKDGLEMVVDGVHNYYMDWDSPQAIQNYEELYGSKGLEVQYLPEDLSMIRVWHPRREKSYILAKDQFVAGSIMDAKDNPELAKLWIKKKEFHRELMGAVIAKHERVIANTEKAMQSMSVDAQGVLKSMFLVDGGNKQYINEAKEALKNMEKEIKEPTYADLYDDAPIAVNNLPNQDEGDLYD